MLSRHYYYPGTSETTLVCTKLLVLALHNKTDYNWIIATQHRSYLYEEEYVCVCTYVYLCTCVRVRVYTYVRVCACTRVYTRVPTCDGSVVCICVYAGACIWIRTRVSAYAYVHVCVSMHLCSFTAYSTCHVIPTIILVDMDYTRT